MTMAFTDQENKMIDDYINNLYALQKTDPGKAKEKATRALIRTGVLNKNGTEKENIVSWA